jgi:hypothetical protein
VRQGLQLDVLEEARYRLELTGKPILGYVFAEATPSAPRSSAGYWTAD